MAENKPNALGEVTEEIWARFVELTLEYNGDRRRALEAVAPLIAAAALSQSPPIPEK